MDKNSVFSSLLCTLYDRLDRLFAALPSHSGENPCGSCHSCCAYPIHLQVSALELLHIEEREPSFAKKPFLDFINRVGGDEGQKVCPNYDMASHRCAIYRHRPLCCRVFGYVPYRTMGEHCVFHSRDRREVSWRPFEKLFSEFSQLRSSFYRENRAHLKPLTVMDYLMLGNILVEEGAIQEGFSFYDRALALDAGSAMTYSYQAKKYEMQNLFEDAAEAYDKALKCDPEEPSLMIKRGYVLAETGRHQEALRLYNEAIKRDRDNYMAYGNMGSLLLTLNAPEEALAAYRRAIEIEPSISIFHIMSGNILDLLGRLEEACRAYETALSLDGDDALAHLCLGKIYRKRGMAREALGSFQRFHDCTPNPAFKDLACREMKSLQIQ